MLLIKPEAIKKVLAATHIKDVREMVGNAVILELATLPTYYTGIFSIKPGKNAEAKALTHSVAFEEMLHLTLASNLLISIGGSPAIYKDGSTLEFPTPLPNMVDPSLKVELASMEKGQIYNVYMGIEHPDTTAILPGEEKLHPVALNYLAAKKENEKSYNSIGDFYNAILKKLEELTNPFANPCTEQQIDISKYFPRVYAPDPCGGELILLKDGKVINIESARNAVNAILAQGEGAQVGNDPINPRGGLKDSFAHYFKFAEIHYGHKLKIDKTSKSGWSYSGDSVPLDQNGVYTFRKNTALSDYDKNHPAYYPAQEFYSTYLRLLKALDDAFNSNTKQLDSAISIMFELKLAANKVVQFSDPKDSKCTAAPPFMAINKN